MRFTKAKTKHVVHFLGSHGLAALWCWGRPTFWVASPARSEEMWSFPTYVACSVVCAVCWASCAKTDEPIDMSFGGSVMWAEETLY